jgi:hypothetical protein
MRCPDLQDLPPPEADRSAWPLTEASAPVAGGDLPRISIVIPSFNQGRYIEEALRSVLLQGYPDLELIVTDGGSTDQTVAFIRKYERWIAHWVSAPDRGQSSAINEGFRHATGDIFAWIGCDDRLLPGALARVGACFAQRPECAWLAGAGKLAFQSGRVGQMASRIDRRDDLIRYWLWGSGCFVFQPSCFWRRQLWEAAGGVREDLHLAMDYELWLRFAGHAKLTCIEDVLSVALREAGGKTFEQARAQRVEVMRCAHQHHARQRAGTMALGAGLLRWYVADRLHRSARHLAQFRLADGTVDLVRAILAPLKVTHERGRLAMMID